MTAAITFEGVSKRFTIRRHRQRTLRETALGLFEHGRNREMARRAGLPSTAALAASEELWALRDVDFAVAPGDCLGLIGPNGSGKSTALKLMTRILEPTAGRVRVRGRVSALLELGAGFHPDLTGRENIYLNGSVLGIDRKSMSRRLDAIVAFAEMDRFIDMPVKHYSSGMYMRLGFSIAVNVEPDVLLTDEVLAVGDQEFQNKCMERIGEIKRDGVTIVFVSHNLDAVRGLCNRSVWLDQGRVAALGPSGDVIDAYLAGVAEKEEARLAGERSAEAAGVEGFGSGDVAITSVRFLNSRGADARVFYAGAPMTVRIAYHAGRRVERPVFGVAIYRSDGVHVNGPNTRLAGLDIPFIEGDGAVDYVIEGLPLLAGSYDLSAAIYDYDCVRPFDHRHRAHKFLVQNGAVTEQFGMVYAPSHWEHVAR